VSTHDIPRTSLIYKNLTSSRTLIKLVIKTGHRNQALAQPSPVCKLHVASLTILSEKPESTNSVQNPPPGKALNKSTGINPTASTAPGKPLSLIPRLVKFSFSRGMSRGRGKVRTSKSNPNPYRRIIFRSVTQRRWLYLEQLRCLTKRMTNKGDEK